MKAMKKVLAMLLALAMIVTAVPVADASAATYKLKAGSISKTLYAGRTHTLKLNGVTASKVKSTKWTVGKTSVAKLSNTDKTKATMKLVGKGYTVVTAKVTLKTKKTKTYKAKITVKNPSLTVDKTALDLIVGEVAQIKVTDSKPDNATLTYASRDTAIATVAGGKVVATGIGTTEIVTSVVCGTKKVSKVTTVTVSAAQDGLTARLTNPLDATEYPNTIMVGQHAMVDVICVSNGKPVVGKTVVMTLDANKATGAGVYTLANDGYEVVNPQRETDENGVAHFIIRDTKSINKDTAINRIANIPFAAQVQGDASTLITGSIAFVAIEFTDVKVDSGAKKETWGENFADLHGNGHSVIKTADMAKPTTPANEYVMTQQVSTDSTDHAVKFKGGYPVITWPEEAGDETNAYLKEDTSDAAKFESAAYHTNNYGHWQYSDKTTFGYQLTESMDKLTYATMHFKDLKISDYTELMILTYESKDKADNDTRDYYARTVGANGLLQKYEIKGDSNMEKFDYQIRLETSKQNNSNITPYILVTIESAGQVDLGLNAGFKVDGVTYVYKEFKNKVGTKSSILKNAKIEWNIVDTPMTDEQILVDQRGANGDYTVPAATYGVAIKVVKGGKLTYKVPAFPYTGNAVLTNYDANGDVINYYVVETSNNGNNMNTLGEKTFTGNAVTKTEHQGYEIDTVELRDKVGQIVEQSEDGSSFKVNSKESGRTTLMGTVTINGEPFADAEYARVFTSVHWNPIPYALPSQKAAGAFIGQSIEVVAQMVDQNGNYVTRSGETIAFSQVSRIAGKDETNSINKGTTRIGGYKHEVDNDVKCVYTNSTTDRLGQVKMVLSASKIRMIKNLSASCASRKYDVVLIVKDLKGNATEIKNGANLYWLDANLKFDWSSQITGDDEQTSATNTQVKYSKKAIQPRAGSVWEYGVEVKVDLGDTEGVSYADLHNVDAHMAKVGGGVGTVSEAGYGQRGRNYVKATSKQAGAMEIVAKLDAKSITSEFSWGTGNSMVYAGTGNASLNKKLTLPVTWVQDGITFDFVTPNGTSVFDKAGNDEAMVYVRVTDKFGNPLQNEKVTFTKDNDKATEDAFVAAAGWTPVSNDGNKAEVKTDEFGIAAVILREKDGTTNTSTIVSAEVEGLNTGKAKVYRWAQPTEVTALDIDDRMDEAGKIYLTNYDNVTGTVTLTFTANIVASSLQKEMIQVWFDKNLDQVGNITGDKNEEVELAVKSVDVIDNVVTIAVNNQNLVVNKGSFVKVEIQNNYTPKNDKGKTDSVSYTMTSEDGMQYAGNPVFRIACYREYGFEVKDATTGEVNTISVKADKAVDGLASAIAAVTYDKAIAEIAALSVTDGDTALILPTKISGEEVGAGMGSLAETQITWNSTNDNVASFAVNTPGAKMRSAVTSPGAINYKMTYKGAGITKLTATVQAYTKVVSGSAVTLSPVSGAKKTVTYIVIAGTKGFTQMFEPEVDDEGTVKQSAGVTYGGLWGQKGIVDCNSTTEGLAPDFENWTNGGVTDIVWTSSNEDVIKVTGTFTPTGYGNQAFAAVMGKDGTATLTATVTSATPGGGWAGSNYVLTFDVTVASGKATYTKLVISKN